MKNEKHVVAGLMALCVGMACAAPQSGNGNGEPASSVTYAGKAKNIVFMVPDGMGLSYVTAARIFKNGPNGDPLNFETLPVIGYQRTHSKNSTVTDSAAAASAWAAGEKFNNGEISLHDDDGDGNSDGPVKPTILELAKQKGKAVGLVASSTITHATPAAFGAHVHVRKCETEIARQYIEETGVDVILGGGFGPDASACKTPSGKSAADIIDIAQFDMGYTYVTTESGMCAATAGGVDKLLGLFTAGGKTIEAFRVDETVAYPDEEPTLAEMTLAALDILEEDHDGFFLMVEGSQIDWAGHANDLDYLLAEMLGFEAAVEVVMDWTEAKPSRQAQTLIVVVGDHETGGLQINGPYGSLSEAGDKIGDGWTTGSHTAADTVIWSGGPGCWAMGAAIDNTDLYHIMKDVLE
jgi:alkaline phosphatase